MSLYPLITITNMAILVIFINDNESHMIISALMIMMMAIMKKWKLDNE